MLQVKGLSQKSSYYRYMNNDYNISLSQPFDPNQIINLKSKTNNQVVQLKSKSEGKINLSQKINLKNHIYSTYQKAVAGNRLNCRKKAKIKQEKEQMDSYFNSNLDPYSESASNRITSKPVASNDSQLITFSKNSKPSQSAKMIQPNQIQQSVQIKHQQLAQPDQDIQNTIVNNLDVVQNAKKHKISMVDTDFISMRYECFCSRQYFTYCSIYNHLKREHLEFLKQNRRFSFTNVYQTDHPVHGYRIKKIMRERLKCPRGQKKSQVQRLTKHTKEKIKAQSHKIQALFNELRVVENERQEQIQMLKLLDKRFLKASELIRQYQQMIFGFQNIFDILNITQITRKLNSGPTVFDQTINQPESDYFPQ